MALCDRCRAEMISGYRFPPEYDPERGIFTADGKALHLSPTQADILMILWTRRNTIVHRETLMRLIWGNRELKSPESNLRETVRQLRIRIDGTNSFAIVTDQKRGYMLKTNDTILDGSPQ